MTVKKEIFESINLKEFNRKDPYDFQERNGIPFSDELIIRKAKIYKIMGPKDDRLQVMPIPEFMGINDEELDNLPIYPMFFKGEVITGEAIKKDPNSRSTPTKDDIQKADCVWCMCTRDFSVGYIFAGCNDYGSAKKDVAYKNSYDWNSIKNFLHQRQALPEDFDYKNLIVTSFTSSSISCYNRVSGDWILMNSSGSILTVQQKKIYMCVGSPPNPISSGPVGFSFISMTPDKMELSSPNIELNYTDLFLGKNNMSLGALLTQGPVIGRNGVSVVPVPTIHV